MSNYIKNFFIRFAFSSISSMVVPKIPTWFIILSVVIIVALLVGGIVLYSLGKRQLNNVESQSDPKDVDDDQEEQENYDNDQD